eukprot:c17587_g1_i1.p1 GENE.c17587_g1_i1~~c17587_g1_i1.p1  ORF type:complete len:200 (-),score=28.49 c17587_g1_i1:39-638(-)
MDPQTEAPNHRDKKVMSRKDRLGHLKLPPNRVELTQNQNRPRGFRNCGIFQANRAPARLPYFLCSNLTSLQVSETPRVYSPKPIQRVTADERKVIQDHDIACASCFIACMRGLEFFTSPFGATEQPQKTEREKVPKERETPEQKAQREQEEEERQQRERERRDYHKQNRVQPGTPEHDRLKRKEKFLSCLLCCFESNSI